MPLVATAPLQPPEAVHPPVALAEFQVKLELAPLATVVGVAASVTVGAGSVTTTWADCEAEPPAPVHVSEYIVVEARGEVVKVPLVCRVPLHPPDAVQLFALLAFHFNVVD